jgi:hypothetical protein
MGDAPHGTLQKKEEPDKALDQPYLQDKEAEEIF